MLSALFESHQPNFRVKTVTHEKTDDFFVPA